MRSKIVDFLTERRVLKFVKKYLQIGFYYFDKQDLTLKRIVFSNFSLKKFFHSHFVIGESKRINDLKFNYGGEKIIIFLNDKAFSFFKDKSTYLFAKKNWNKYSSSITFPAISISYFDDKKRMNESVAICGNVFRDKMHDLLAVEKMIDFAVTASFDCREHLYLQHGDSKRGNLIWVNDNRFVFADLDGIRFYPALFDVLHYLNGANYSFEEIIDILKTHNEKINIIFNNVYCDVSKNHLDDVFFDYVSFLSAHKTRFWEFRFLITDKISNYKKTHKLLKTLQMIE